MSTFRAKFPGRCAATGRTIKPGDLVQFNQARKVVLAGSDTFTFGDKTFYRNRAGRCEDAPCCGCCTI
jgi:hypothetical protein